MSAWLHILRWMAALAVLVAHVQDMVSVPLSEVPAAERGAAVYAWAFMGGFSHLAVVVFFVLSGYLVGGAALIELLETGNIQLRRYFTKRLTRIYVVLAPALLVCAVCDYVGAGIVPGSQRYAWAMANAFNWETAACNLLSLQTVHCYAFGTDRALWSLANEVGYYVLWPLFLAPFMRKRSIGQRAILFALGLLFALAVSSPRYSVYPIIPYMLIWMVGVVPVVMRRPMFRSLPGALAAFVATLLLIRAGVPGAWWDSASTALGFDGALAVATSALLASLVHSGRQPNRFETWRFHKWLSEFSFSLYVVHLPVLVLLSSWWINEGIVAGPSAASSLGVWAAAAALASIAVAVAYVFSLATERHTAVVRQRLETAWSAKRSSERDGRQADPLPSSGVTGAIA